MEIILIILAFILLLTGIAGAVLPILPGPTLSFLGLVLIQWSGIIGPGVCTFHPAFLIGCAIIAVAVTAMDYFLPSIMSRRFGGSRSAAIGSFLGLLVGIFFFPPFGMIIGPFLGAFAGELIHNRSSGAKAFKVALGAFLAFIAGSGAKLIVSSLMLFFAVRAVFF